MTSGDVVAIGGVIATLITAGASAVTLIRRHSGEMSKKEQQELEECSDHKRALRRVVTKLSD